MARPRFDFASIRLSAVAFTVTAAVEFTLMSIIDGLGFEHGGGLLGGLSDGAIMGLCVGGMYLVAKCLIGRSNSSCRATAPFSNAAVLAIVTLCFETALHLAIEEFAGSRGAGLVALVNALTLAAIVTGAAAWLDLIDRDVVRHTNVQSAGTSTHGSVILSGALVMALCVSIVPFVLIGTTARSVERTEGVAELVNLTGRQRTFSQRIALLAHQPSPERREELRQTMAVTMSELGRINTLTLLLMSMSERDRAALANGPTSHMISALRTRYLADAVAVLEAKTPRARARALARLDASADAFLPAMDSAASEVERVAERRLAEQSATAAVLTIFTPMMIFGLALAMLWPILRLLAAQQKGLEANARVVEFSRNPVVRTDKRLNVTWANAAFLDMTGYALDEVQGRRLGGVVFQGAEPDTVALMRNDIFAGRPARGTVQITTKSRGLVWLELDIQPQRSTGGGVGGFQIVATDVTQLQAAREAADEAAATARRQQLLLATMSRMAGVGAWEFDVATQSLAWSDETRRIHDVDPDAPISWAMAEQFYVPESRLAINQALKSCRANGDGYDLELEIVTARGCRRFVRCIGEFVRDGERPARFIGAVLDITEDRLRKDAAAREQMRVQIVARVKSAFLEDDATAAFETAIAGINEMTQSPYGFIAEVVREPGGAKFLRTMAITDVTSSDETQRTASGAGWAGFELRSLETLAGAALKTNAAVIVNDPANEPRPPGLPQGHPPMDAFLGAPIYFDSKMIGLVGLANRPGGYDKSVLEDLGPLLEALGRLIAVRREREARRDAEARTQEALRRADKALRDLSAYQSALDQHAIVAITDPRGVIEFVNDRFCQISGYGREELVGSTHAMLNSRSHPKAFFVDMWRTISRGDIWHGEICNRSKSGATYWVDTTIVPMLDDEGRPMRFVSVRYDITERKVADERLANALAQVSGFFDISLDLLCIADAEGRFVRVSTAFEAVLGYPASQLEGHPFMDLVHPDDVAATQAIMAQLNGGAEVIDFVNRYRTADGDYRAIEWRASPKNGLIYAAARDITERLAHERELIQARRDAEAASNAKSAFLANMSHEIRTPLNGLTGLLGVLSTSTLDGKQKEIVDLLSASSHSLERLLSDILDHSKIEAGRLELEIATFDLVQAVETAAQLMRVRADDKGLAFEIRYGASARGLFEGDAVRLRQVIANLTSNAIKFTDAGHVHVDVDVVDAADGLASAVTIAVDDTGVGFDEEAATRLFGRFEQADQTIARRFGGTGLGLAISRALVEMMGGEISATSTVGVGSRFTVTLPLPRAVPLAEFDARVNEAPGGVSTAVAHDDSALRILVAEDHPTNRRVVELILEPLGASLTFAENGRQAVEAFESAVFDLVLMDMQMPVMDGLAATQEIRRIEAERGAPRTPIAMLSANAMREHVEMGFAAGCDDYIAKPVTPTALIGGIAALLAGRNSQDEAPERISKGDAERPTRQAG